MYATRFEPTAHAPDSLWCECYFWHEEDNTASACNNFFNGIEIDLSFARSCHSVQQSDAELTLFDIAVNGVHAF
jgi:hypothetical protein